MDVGEFLNFEDDAFQLLRKLLVPKCGILIKTCIKFSTNAALRVAAVVLSVFLSSAFIQILCSIKIKRLKTGAFIDCCF